MSWKRVLALALGMTLLEMVNVGAAPPAAPADAMVAPAEPEAGVSATIAPGDDFFAYANGAWLDTTQVPDGRARWGARDEIAGTTRQQVADVVAAAVTRRADDSERKVADFYSAYLDEATIETRGIAPLAALLKTVEPVRNKTALARWLGGNLAADVDPLNFGVYSSRHNLIGLAADHGIHGETKNFAYLLQGGLGLPTRDSYIDDAEPARELRGRYLQYVARMLDLAGFDRAHERAVAVLALETAVARIHAPDDVSAKEQNADHHWARAEFPARAPGMDWNAFFAAAGLAQQDDFVAWQPDALAGTAALIASEPLAAWQDYLRFHLIDRYAEVLPLRFAEAERTFRGTGAPTTRAQRALDAITRLMPLAVGRLYVEKHFPFEAKANVQAILANVLDAFRHRVDNASWMTPAGKVLAQAKLNTLYFGVGYPDKWPDDSALAIDRRDAFGNLRRIAAWNHRSALARLARPVDRHDWSISPQSAMGSLNFLRNSYNFSAALLQPPKFDRSASEAANYGAIGAIFGHEISHFVDTLGADYDARGAVTHWWTEADAEQYDAACHALEIQFSTYRPFPDLALNGRLTRVENVADLAGLAAAFDAYRRVLGSRASNREYLRQQDRQFFIGFARAWRVKFTDDGLRTQSTGNDHAPEIFRVATVRNLDAWYDAFDVQPGQRLYLPPTRARASGSRVKITVCELPHEPGPLATAWAALCEHVAKHRSELVLLPEFAFVEPFWERDYFDAERWDEGVSRSAAWSQRLSELGAVHVVSTRPATVGRRHFNEGYIWSSGTGLVPLRSKWFLPDEPGGWEARWFVRGHREFPRFTASRMSFGLNICTELWALETYASYAEMGIHAVLCPRATCAATLNKWRSAGTVAAVRSGAYCLSSNRVHADGSCAGGGWIIGPDGDLLATTTLDRPFCTIELDFGAVKASSQTYPRYVFARP